MPQKTNFHLFFTHVVNNFFFGGIKGGWHWKKENIFVIHKLNQIFLILVSYTTPIFIRPFPSLLSVCLAFALLTVHSVLSLSVPLNFLWAFFPFPSPKTKFSFHFFLSLSLPLFLLFSVLMSIRFMNFCLSPKHKCLTWMFFWLTWVRNFTTLTFKISCELGWLWRKNILKHLKCGAEKSEVTLCFKRNCLPLWGFNLS